MDESSHPLLSLERLSKAFPGQRALDEVSLEIRAGEIYGLAGHNGSGKSTLVKILAGYHTPDPPSRAWFDGEQVDPHAARAGWRRRQHFVHQDLGLVESFDAVENVALAAGYNTGRGGRIRWAVQRRDVAALIADLGMSFDITVPVAWLSPAERVTVAIARALAGWEHGPGLLVLDEPTAAFPAREAGRLFSAVRGVAAAGNGVLFVSHRLDEIVALADRVGVLRDGRLVCERRSGELDHATLVSMVAGHRLEPVESASRSVAPSTAGELPALAAQNLAGGLLHGLSLAVRANEILGVAGESGSGREQVAHALVGDGPTSQGRIVVAGRSLENPSPRAAAARGVALVPADRAREGAIPEFSVRENVTLPRLWPFWRRGRLDRCAETAEVGRWIGRVGLTPADPELTLALLSGGNQQKAVLAKWLRTDPRVLVLDEPIRGMDVAARAAIHGLLEEIAQSGTAVVICSAEAEWLAAVCHRVIVLRKGRQTAELAGDTLTARQIAAESFGSDGPSNPAVTG